VHRLFSSTDSVWQGADAACNCHGVYRTIGYTGSLTVSAVQCGAWMWFYFITCCGFTFSHAVPILPIRKGSLWKPTLHY
jgi:hypothetical protein